MTFSFIKELNFYMPKWFGLLVNTTKFIKNNNK